MNKLFSQRLVQFNINNKTQKLCLSLYCFLQRWNSDFYTTICIKCWQQFKEIFFKFGWFQWSIFKLEYIRNYKRFFSETMVGVKLNLKYLQKKVVMSNVFVWGADTELLWLAVVSWLYFGWIPTSKVRRQKTGQCGQPLDNVISPQLHLSTFTKKRKKKVAAPMR